MPVQLQVSSFTNSALGSLVYHFVLLLAVQAALAMAWGEWRRTGQAQAKRVFTAMAGITLAFLGYLAATMATGANLVSAEALLPLYGRFANTVGIAFLGWAYAPTGMGRTRLWNILLSANLLLAIGALVASVLLWQYTLANSPTLYVNGYWLSAFWSVWQISLLLLGILAVARSQEAGWGTVMLALIVMLGGQILQLVYQDGASGAWLPTWTRTANLIAYPLVAVAVYQHAMAGLREHSRQLEEISQASLEQIKSLLQLSEASRRISGTLDLGNVLDIAAQSITRALEADLCAIALELENDPKLMRLAAVHNPEGPKRGDQITFPAEFQLPIQEAMRHREHVIVEESDELQIRALFGLMGSSDTGPLLVQPLLSNGGAIGAILVGNPRTHRAFSQNEAKLCGSIAAQLENAVQNARHYQIAQRTIETLRQAQTEEQGALERALAQVKDLAETMNLSEAESEALREARNDLEIKLLSSRSEVETLTTRLAALEVDLARQQAEWQGTLQAMLPGMAAGVLVTDARGVIRATNMAAEILFERSGNELQGLELTEISPDSEWQQAVKLAHEGNATHVELRVGNSRLTCDVAPLPQPGADQLGMEGLVVILQNVSPEVEAHLVRLETIAAMADELRTPMSTVIGYADLLLSEAMGGITGVQRKFLMRIKADAERMIQAINDLARQAGGEEQWSHPQPQTLDVNEEVEEAVEAAHVQFEIKGLAVQLELGHNLPAVEADPGFLRRILSGLLSNACLVSPVGGSIQIQSTHSADPKSGRSLLPGTYGYVTVSVTDQGGGLSDAALDQVFDRTRPSQTPPGLGESGPGLVLVRQLVEAHGGHLWVECRDGVSTTFSFMLPVLEQEEGAQSNQYRSEQDQPAPADVTTR